MMEQPSNRLAGPVDQADHAARIADWSLWRGEVSATVRQHEARLNDMYATVVAGFERAAANFDRRMDAQDAKLERNGAATEEIARSVASHEKKLYAAAALQQEDKERRTYSFNVRELKIDRSALFAAAILGAVVTELVARVFG